MKSLLGAVLLLGTLNVSPDTAEPASQCALAEVEFVAGRHSQAISALNQCMTDEKLTPEERACVILNRAKSYFAMDQTDKGSGDGQSALRGDPHLQEASVAATCLHSSLEVAQSMLERIAAGP